VRCDPQPRHLATIKAPHLIQRLSNGRPQYTTMVTVLDAHELGSVDHDAGVQPGE
jgi:hypothetical protein